MQTESTLSIHPADWSTIQPHVDALLDEALDPGHIPGWLRRWSELAAVLAEAGAQAYRDVTENTADEAAEARFTHLVTHIMPQIKVAEQALKQKLLAVEGYQPSEDEQVLLRRFHTEVEIFRPDNVALESELTLLGNQYIKRVGGMTVEWQGEQEPISKATSRLEHPDRMRRETIWRRIMARYLADREPLNALYLRMLPLRRACAANAGMSDYRAYRWQQLARFDYTPDDAFTFHDAIEHEVTPLASELYRRRAARLGIPRVRPWDVDATLYEEPLQPAANADELEEGCQRIFDQVDPVLGGYFTAMRDGYLDLAARANKAPGAYCNGFPISRKPYIFMSSVGTHSDVTTLLHEGGHAFHFMESQRQPLLWNYDAPMEFCEVASMSMELLSAPYLTRERGGFYNEVDARRAYADQLHKIVLFLPYMAVVDGFQHWVYREAPEHVEAADLDRVWSQLWDRFLPEVDYSGLDDAKETGWHRKPHIFEAPFYYIEYGLAQLGALQVWRNALRHQRQAVADYRSALALGYTRPLPELFAAAGARFAFDRPTVRKLMTVIREQLARLEG